MTLSTEEFLRRFLLHWLPRGFVRIRFFGFLANRRRAKLLPVCRQLLAMNVPASPRSTESGIARQAAWSCPLCGGPMTIVERLTADDLLRESTTQSSLANSS
jgi:hypothetical protein